MKIKGPWLNATRLLKNYPARLAYVRRQMMKDMAELLYSYLMVTIPDTEEFRIYRDSIKVVEITDLSKSVAFAVISDRSAVKLGDISAEEAMQTVVYIEYKGRKEPPALLSLVMQTNPWPLELVPNGLDPKTTILIHRRVSDAEYKKVRQNTMVFISANKDIIKGSGGSWGKAEEGQHESSQMKSLPDFMTMALRAEFGIMGPSKPHWRKSVRSVTSRVKEIIKNDANIKKALYDWLFREHLGAPVPYEDDMRQNDFVKEAGEFQKVIIGTLGGQLR
ncbi:hypothetical protein E2P64_08165 [Candidatus Bathyarchaeota archaeon]|nr:hypothetical protein E2P64_08165 [Candidatus Bathyarchaeota archaeon]